MPKRVFVKSEEHKNENENEKLSFTVGQYDATYDVANSICRMVGIYLISNHPRWKRVFFDFLYWLQFAHQVIAVTLEIINVIETAKRGSFDDAVEIFRMMPCIGYLFLAMSKSWKVIYYRTVFVNLMKELRQMWPVGELEAEEQAVVENALRQLRQVVKGYYWCNMSLLGIFLAPKFMDLVKHLAGYDGPLLLPFFYWLPFDSQQHPHFEILLVTQFWIGITVIFFIILGDLLFCTFLNHITMYLDLLAVRIRRLIFVPADRQMVPEYPLAQYSEEYLKGVDEDVNAFDSKQWEKRHQEELSDIVLRHRDLIRLAEDVEELYSFSLLVNFFNSSIIICFCGFCIAVVEEWTEQTYKIFIVCCLSQTWLMCWYGQKLIESTEGLSEALYNCGWYKASKKVKSSIIIMIYRTQKAVHVTTYGFSIISLQSYTTIIKSSWSYFTLLLNIYNK